MLERDPELLEQLEALVHQPFSGEAFRVVWEGCSPIQGSNGKRGRWNSAEGIFEILNTSLVKEGARAEFEAFWSLFEQRPDRKARCWKLKVRLRRVARLTLDDLEKLGVSRTKYANREYSRTQEIADALNYLGYDGLIVPSAQYKCDNLIIFMQNIDKDCCIDEIDSETFSWID